MSQFEIGRGVEIQPYPAPGIPPRGTFMKSAGSRRSCSRLLCEAGFGIGGAVIHPRKNWSARRIRSLVPAMTRTALPTTSAGRF